MIIVLIILFSFFMPQDDTQFELRISGIEEVKGTMMIAIYQPQQKFLGDEAFLFKAIPVKQSESLSLNINLPAGKYAISIYQDLNDDRELNTNFLGIPREPYGFSISRGSFGPPSFDDASFEVPSLNSIEIKIE
ncbi:MAG: DUF2141 domain-containing protein [Bacteroidota bacterium]